MGNRPPALRGYSEEDEIDIPDKNAKRTSHSRHKIKLIKQYLPDFILTSQSNDYDLYVIRCHWDQLCALEKSTMLFDSFYTYLFDAMPEIKPMFHSSMQFQGRTLMNIVGGIKSILNSKHVLERASRLALRHVTYGVRCEHFNALGVAFMMTLESLAPSEWNNEVCEAWRTVYCHTSVLVLSKLHNELNPENKWNSMKSFGSIGRHSSWDSLRLNGQDGSNREAATDAASPLEAPSSSLATNSPRAYSAPPATIAPSDAMADTNGSASVMSSDQPTVVERPASQSSLPPPTDSPTVLSGLSESIAKESVLTTTVEVAPVEPVAPNAGGATSQQQEQQQQQALQQQQQHQESTDVSAMNDQMRDKPLHDKSRSSVPNCNITAGLLMEVFDLREQIELVRDEKEALECELRLKLEFMEMTIQKLSDENDLLRNENELLRNHQMNGQEHAAPSTGERSGDANGVASSCSPGSSSQDNPGIPSLVLSIETTAVKPPPTTRSPSSPKTIKFLRGFGHQPSSESTTSHQHKKFQTRAYECPIPMSAEMAQRTSPRRISMKKVQSNGKLEIQSQSHTSLPTKTKTTTSPRSPRSIRNLRRSSYVAPSAMEDVVAASSPTL